MYSNQKRRRECRRSVGDSLRDRRAIIFKGSYVQANRLRVVPIRGRASKRGCACSKSTKCRRTARHDRCAHRRETTPPPMLSTSCSSRLLAAKRSRGRCRDGNRSILERAIPRSSAYYIADKAVKAGNDRVMLTEREAHTGTAIDCRLSFSADHARDRLSRMFRCLTLCANTGSAGGASGGKRGFCCRSCVPRWQSASCVFCEVHPDPANAKVTGTHNGR